MRERYAVFAFDQYYPRGGLQDLIARTETIEQARAASVLPRFKNDGGWDFFQIVDMESWAVVEVGGVLGTLYEDDLRRGVVEAERTWPKQS